MGGAKGVAGVNRSEVRSLLTQSCLLAIRVEFATSWLFDRWSERVEVRSVSRIVNSGSVLPRIHATSS